MQAQVREWGNSQGIRLSKDSIKRNVRSYSIRWSDYISKNFQT